MGYLHCVRRSSGYRSQLTGICRGMVKVKHKQALSVLRDRLEQAGK